MLVRWGGGGGGEGGSLDPEGGNLPYGENDLGCHSTLGQMGVILLGGHSTLRHRLQKSLLCVNKRKVLEVCVLSTIEF